MQTIRTQYDLDRLPQPRLIFTAAPWLRQFAVTLLAAGFLGCLAVAWKAAGHVGWYALCAVLAAAVCAAVFLYARPYDWRAWVNVAATQGGLYVTARRARMVFVPWKDVLDIGIERTIDVKGSRDFPRLKLRMSEADWSLFGKQSNIRGTGPVREYLFSPAGETAQVMVDQLKSFRGAAD